MRMVKVRREMTRGRGGGARERGRERDIVTRGGVVAGTVRRARRDGVGVDVGGVGSVGGVGGIGSGALLGRGGGRAGGRGGKRRRDGRRGWVVEGEGGVTGGVKVVL